MFRQGRLGTVGSRKERNFSHEPSPETDNENNYWLLVKHETDLLRVPLVGVCVVDVLLDGYAVGGDVRHLHARRVRKHPQVLE